VCFAVDVSLLVGDWLVGVLVAMNDLHDLVVWICMIRVNLRVFVCVLCLDLAKEPKFGNHSLKQKMDLYSAISCEQIRGNDKMGCSTHDFWSTVSKTIRPVLSDWCLSCPVCLSVTSVYCGQTIEWIKMPLGTKVGLGPGHIVLDGDPAPHHTPTFWPMSIVAKQSPISATAELL